MAADLMAKRESLFRDACPAADRDDDERLGQVAEVDGVATAIVLATPS